MILFITLHYIFDTYKYYKYQLIIYKGNSKMTSQLCKTLIAECGGLKKARECDYTIVSKKANKLVKHNLTKHKELFEEFEQTLLDHESL